MTLVCVRFEPGVLTFQSQGREGLRCQLLARPGPAAKKRYRSPQGKLDDVTKLWMSQCNRQSLSPAVADDLFCNSDPRLVKSCSSGLAPG